MSNVMSKATRRDEMIAALTAARECIDKALTTLITADAEGYSAASPTQFVPPAGVYRDGEADARMALEHLRACFAKSAFRTQVFALRSNIDESFNEHFGTLAKDTRKRLGTEHDKVMHHLYEAYIAQCKVDVAFSYAKQQTT